ncbi:MAG: hypothetical protein ABI969_15615 [bacterium]
MTPECAFRPLRALPRFIRALSLVAAIASPALAQFGGPPNTSTGPQLPKRGAIPRDTAYERKVLAEIKAPSGFAMTLFAGPPFAMYPTAVAPSPDGSVYVGVDLNLAQGAVKGRGRVMRLVDVDGDGRADTYTTFIDVDSPRGIVADGKTVYVLHPPNLTAYRDTDGDGIADQSDDLVKNIGFSLDVRSSDHATNNITLGPDGWIYIAVGDYGFLNATGKDGTVITRHGGALARVRQDGTGLELVTTGTRNMFDVGIDPLGHAFARDNTNDGGGWDTRFHYLAPGADMGYPAKFRYFASENMPSIADYGAGAGTAGLWIQDPGFPAEWNNTLYTGDWTVNRVFRHRVTPKGASYGIDQTEFMTVPHAIDIAMDDHSHLYVASLIGGVFNYAGDTVGAIVRVSYPGKTPSPGLHAERATDTQLLAAVVSDNAMHRVWAQQELVRRGAKTATVQRLSAFLADRTRRLDARTSAMFTLKRLAGAKATPTLLKAATDPTMRESALRVLVDDTRDLKGVPVDMYLRALGDTNFAVRVQGLRGLVKLGARDHADAIVPLLTSPDSALAHLAVQSIVALGARDVALRAMTAPASSPELRMRARQVVQQFHDAETVSAVVDVAAKSSDAAVKREALLTLARLYNTDAAWTGDWWGTHPSTLGPYFAPAAWAESPRIRPALRGALASASGNDYDALIEAFVRNRVLPSGSKPLFVAVASDAAMRSRAIDAFVGASVIEADALPLMAELGGRGPAFRGAITELLAGESTYGPQTLPLVRAAALDTTGDPAARGRLITALTASPAAPGFDVATEVFAPLTPGAPSTGTPSPVESAWRRYVGDFRRYLEIDHFIELAHTGTAEQRTLAYAVLVQSVRSQRTPAPIREKVTPAIDAGWSDAASTPSLVRAITLMKLEAQYAARLQALKAASGAHPPNEYD